MVDNSEGDSSGNDDFVFDGSFGVIGDFHYLLSAEYFRERLESADVIFLEYPDDELNEIGVLNGVKNAYSFGGYWVAFAFFFVMLKRRFFARGSLISVLLSDYLDKVVGVEGSDEREFYMQNRDISGFTAFVLVILLFVLLPSFIVIALLKSLAQKNGEKKSSDLLVVEDFEAIASDDGERGVGMDERDVAMVTNVGDYLEAHSESEDIDEVVMVVGMAHAASIIELLESEGIVSKKNMELLNPDISSELLLTHKPYQRLKKN